MTAEGVVISGASAGCCVGLGRDAFLGALRTGAADGGSDTRPMPALPEEAWVNPRTRTDQRMTAALILTLEHDLGEFLLSLSEEQRENVGVALGHAYGHQGAYFDYFSAATEKGSRSIHPLRFLGTLPNYTASEISSAYSLWGSSTPVGTGWTAGLEAIGCGTDMVRSGAEVAVLAGGFDELNACSLRALRAAQVPGSGEGFGIVLIERGEDARRAGREPLAEIASFDCARGALGPGGVARAAAAIARALEEAALSTEDIDLLFSSAGGGAVTDEIERTVLATVLGGRAAEVRATSVKELTGDCLAGTGPLQAIAAAEALRNGQGRNALVCGTGFDGTFAVLVLRAIGLIPTPVKLLWRPSCP